MWMVTVRTMWLVLSLLCVGNLAYAGNDAPHDDANNISCGSCHDEALLSSPFWGVADDITYNNFCLLNCHNSAYGPYTDTSAPHVKAHSSANTSTTYGTWSINCVECHDPHVQRQKLWKGKHAADIFLASGNTVLPIPAYDSFSNTSTVNYGSLSYKAGWDASLLKSKTVSERRTIFFPNLRKLGFSYNVIEIDNPVGTITVEGDASEGFAYVSPPTNFGIIYGQFIRQTIDVNGASTQVKLFSSSGAYSFAYDESESGTDPTPDGICQICHTQTAHWRSDGSLAAQGTHDKFNGGNCTKCHPHREGFKNIYVDHSESGLNYVTGLVSCVSCHLGPEPIMDTHDKNCSYCHQLDMSLQGGLTAGDCSNCHDAYDVSFQNGHQNESHVELTSSANCTATCHSGDLITVVHANTCTKCHNDTTTDGTLKVGIAGNGDATGHTLGTSSSCADCHSAYNTNYQTSHDVKDHTGIASSANCTTSCHTQTTTDDIVNITHAASGCTTCHTNSTSDGTLVNSENGNASNGSGDCAFCHADYNSNFKTAHQVIDHDGLITTANCTTTCHTGDIATGVHNNGCAYCHNHTITNGTLILAGSRSCADCHAAYDGNFNTGHTVKDHSGLIANQGPFEGITENCASCHTGTIINDVHNTQCTGCHINAGPDGSLKDGANNYGDARGHVVGTDSDCDDCHSADGYFNSHIHVHTVSQGGGDLSQEQGVLCSACHNDSGNNLAAWSDILAEHEGNCKLCHNATRDTSQSGTYSIGETIQTVIAANGNPTNCLGCHRDKIDSISADATHGKDHKGSGSVIGSAQCTSCHDPDGNNNNNHYLNTIHGSCDKCHIRASGGGPLMDYSGGGSTIGENVNYRLINLGQGGSCVDCHVSYASDFAAGHKNENHTELTGAANCTTTCHSGAMVAGPHKDTCNSCHVDSASDGTLKVGAGGNGDATSHTIGGSSSCVDCHGDYNSNFETAHDVKDHTGITSSATCTTTCHTQTTVTDIVNTTHATNGCANCHTNTTTDGTLLNSANGDATGGSGSCAGCHSAYGTDFQNHDGGIHAGIIANASPTGIRDDCVSCHTGDLISAVAAGSDPGTHQNVCTNCHVHVTTDGTLKDGANNYGDASGHTFGGNSDCDSCHSGDGYFDSHSHTHQISLDAGDLSQNIGASCGAASCHNDGGNNLANWSSILLEHDAFDGNRDGVGVCTVCHDATRDTSVGGTYSIGATIQTVIAANAATVCADCHRDKIDSIAGADALHRDHVAMGNTTTSAQCSSCHEGSTNSEIVVVIHSCSTCHVGGGGGPLHDYSGSGGTISDNVNYEAINGGAGGACTDCHARYATNFENGHQNESHIELTGIAKCTSCHATALATVMHTSCTKCHTDMVTDGSLKVGASGYGTAADHAIGVPSSCADCHAAYDTNFETGHQNEDHRNVANSADMLTVSVDCTTSCHTANTAATIVSTTHGTTGCTACHNNMVSDGSLINAAKGDASGHTLDTASACADCHTDTWATLHANVDHSTRVQTDSTCNGCHDGSPGSNNTAPNTVTSPYINAGDNEVHSVSGCATCHTAVGVLQAKNGNYTTTMAVNDTCSACHTAYFADHIHDHAASVKIPTNTTDPNTLNCLTSGCHTAATSPFETGLEVHAAGTYAAGGCATCHDPAVGSFVTTAIGDASGSNGECSACHSTFENHQSHTATVHSVSMGSDKSGIKFCNECHRVGGTGHPTNPLFSNVWGGSDGIYDLHSNTCTLCHNSARNDADGNVQSVIQAGASTCLDCHATKSGSHGSHEPADGTFDTSEVNAACSDCHGETPTHPGQSSINGVMEYDIHGNGTDMTCTLCHADGSGGQPPAESSANNVWNNLNANDWDRAKPYGCVDCHVGNPHHAGVTAQAGNCHNCHSDPRSIPAGMAHAPYQISCRACHVTVTGNEVVINSLARGIAGSTADGLASGNVKTPLASHTFTITAGTGAAKIVNYGACLYCHGSTGQGAGRASTGPVPYHGDIGYAGLGGAIVTPGSATTAEREQFRLGYVDPAETPTGSKAYFGPGRGIFNMNHAEYSIQDHYLQSESWKKNFTAHTATYEATVATIPTMYTFFEMYSTNGGSNAVIPVFDADYLAGTQCSGSCDTVTIDVNRCSNGGSCLENRILTVHATSTNSTAQLTVIYGGEATAMSCTNGDCTVSVDFSAEPAMERWDGTDILLNSIWVVSDKGGSDRFENINNR